ncbi:DUF1996 domain-containing protein [Actinomycetospora sp. C-140]
MTGPVRLLAAAAALLVTGGIVVAAGSAAAHEDSGSDSGSASSQSDSDGSGGSGDSGDSDDSGDDAQSAGRDQASPPDDDDYVDITQVSPGADGKGGQFSPAGTFRTDCGRNADGAHRNSDNFVLAPGKRNGAQHVHDYVGTTATFDSSDDQLQSADTTCGNGDQSTYYWPVIRDLNGTGDDEDDDGGGKDGNEGSITAPSSVDLTFHGNPKEDVVAAPQALRLATGDAKAATEGDQNANAKWTCTGFEDRTTTKYPECPQGSRLVRILDFPSCWDGENTDSDDHRSHVAFPEEDGSCGEGTQPIPALRMTLTYDRPDGTDFAVDSFPDQQHDPKTDHASSINFMPKSLMNRAVRCINDGIAC